MTLLLPLFPKLAGPHLFSMPNGKEVTKFIKWWKDDKERRLCTLEQAIGAYIATFPGRLHFLLVELLNPHV